MSVLQRSASAGVHEPAIPTGRLYLFFELVVVVDGIVVADVDQWSVLMHRLSIHGWPSIATVSPDWDPTVSVLLCHSLIASVHLFRDRRCATTIVVFRAVAACFATP
jgi:hypothetical protein